MLINLGAILCFFLGAVAIGLGVYAFEHQQVTNSLFVFILGLVFFNLSVNLLSVRKTSPIDNRYTVLFKELAGLHEDVIEVRDLLRRWKGIVVQHDDLIEPQMIFEEMKTEGADRSNLIEKAASEHRGERRKKGRK